MNILFFLSSRGRTHMGDFTDKDNTVRQDSRGFLFVCLFAHFLVFFLLFFLFIYSLTILHIHLHVMSFDKNRSRFSAVPFSLPLEPFSLTLFSTLTFISFLPHAPPQFTEFNLYFHGCRVIYGTMGNILVVTPLKKNDSPSPDNY